MPNTFANEEYADMNFVYCFYNWNLGLLLCKSGKCIHIAGLHSAEHLKQYTEI